MKLKPLHKAILTLPGGEEVEVERIGKGHFSTAWKNGTSVYLSTRRGDYSKEILAGLPGVPHLPRCEYVGELGVVCIDDFASFNRLRRGEVYEVSAAYDGTPTVEVRGSYHALERFRKTEKCACKERGAWWAGTYAGSHLPGCPALAPGLRGLTDDEYNMLRHVERWGSEGYGAYLQKFSRGGWTWGRGSGGVQGPPTVFKRKQDAVASLESFLGVLRDALAGRA